MKMKILLAALIFGAHLQSTAQKFKWETEARAKNENETEVSHVKDGNYLYRVMSRYNDNLFNRDVTIDTYLGDNFKPEDHYDISVEQPAMGKAMLTHIAMFPTKGENYLSFLEEWDGKTKERTLFAQPVDISTGNKSEKFRVTGIPVKNSEYIVAQSQGRKYFAVLKRFFVDKKDNEKINLALVDESGKLVKEISYQTPYLNKAKSDEFEISVSDDGRIYVVRNIDLAKQKPFRNLYYWDGKSDTMTETSLKLENDHQLYFTKGWFNDGNFYLQGFATRVGSKAVQVYRGSNPASAIYAAKFDKDNKNVYTTVNEIAETGLNVKDIVHENGKTWILADKRVENKKTKPVPGNAFELQTTYNYNNLGYAFARLDDATGKLDFFNEINDEQTGTENDNGKFLSCLYFIRKGELSIMYQDLQKFEFDEKHSKLDRAIIMETYDSSGKLKNKQVLKNTGLEPRYDYGNRQWLEDFDLDTSVLLKLSDDKYIVRSSSGYNERYGYLTF
ncbi:hypothetical protein HUK80_13125 [Flavobacterium sp. MAH-1]|uniref:S9 family peptidase n=1 Tax=Flavobacterium agri TaxID=2743471 RepID=A0A7Y9C7Z1_9FLAO|nr:hypothetical protein [Flavobacterium agri]NUY81843.1 hypothetical protein [Flavobacterium agri]NYA71867.1 hypothetical protein [Flavobacterium agri]